MERGLQSARRISREPQDGAPELRAFSRARPRALLIGASTGGPQALTSLMAQLSPHLGDIPVLIALHMPADFTSLVTAHLERVARRPCLASFGGQEPAAGHIYVAPGQTHLVATRRESGAVRLLHRPGQGHHHRGTAVDTLFTSAARCWGPEALGVVLTGMGSDGLAGARALVAGGGSVIAQDRGSSAVWGMPGAIVREGLASAVLPLEAMADRLAAMLARGGGARA